MTRDCNLLIAGTTFAQRFDRWPRPARHPGATVNDFIFHRMIDPDWSALERSFVDKETAKASAQRLHPSIKAPRTLGVFAMDELRSPEQLYGALRGFIGQDAIAKPTHASGGATFLRDVVSPADLRPLYELASADYATMLREMQYFGLPRKIIVEALVPTATEMPRDDYKFHCVHGNPLICQIDHDRFGAPWSRLFRVPGFVPMDDGDGLSSPPRFRLPADDRAVALIEAARSLAAPFKFVRVDLYDGLDGVYFGELTFTPAAALGIAPSAAGDARESDTHREYSRTIMTALGR